MLQRISPSYTEFTEVSATRMPLASPAVVGVRAQSPSVGNGIPKNLIAKITGKTIGTLAAFLFNNDILNAVPAGGADGSIIYNDGFEGKIYNRALTLADATGRGVQIFGFNITATDVATGEPDSTVFDTLGMEVREYTGNGDTYLPTVIDLAGTARNTANQDGLLTVATEFFLSSMGQLKINVPAGKVVHLVLFTQPFNG